MKELLANLFGIVQQWLKYRNSPISQRIRAEKKVDDDQQAFSDKSNAIKNAVRTKDKDFVNKLLHKCGIIFVASVVSFGFGVGCVTTKEVAVYVPSDREVSPMTNEVGVAGWFVPDTVFEELLIYRLRVQELENQQKVENMIKE